MGLRIGIAEVGIKRGGGGESVRLGCVFREKPMVDGRTYDCHAREDGKGEPGACYGRDLRKPSFQADDGHGCAVFAAESVCSSGDVCASVVVVLVERGLDGPVAGYTGPEIDISHFLITVLPNSALELQEDTGTDQFPLL